MQIPDYIKQKSAEKRELEEQIEKLKAQIEKLDSEKVEIESTRYAALQQKKMTTAELESYSNLKDELKKYNIPVEDISAFAKIVNEIKRRGFDVDKIISEYTDYDSLVRRHKMFLDSVRNLENQYNSLRKVHSNLENEVNSHRQTISIYNDLSAIGFGLKELKMLWHTINEVALANNISFKEAALKFFSDIEEQYDNKLGFESKSSSLRNEVNRLSQERNTLRASLLAQPLVGPVLVRLIQKGVKEQDIINIAHICERHAVDKQNKNTIDMELLITQLNRYQSITSAIEHLNQENAKLTNQVDLLKAQKQVLNAYNQNVLTMSIKLYQLVDFYNGYVHSLRNEIKGLISIASLITYFLSSFQSEQLKKQKLNALEPFVALIRAASGEEVLLSQLKVSIIKAIDIIKEKINDNNDNRLSSLLSEARFELMKN